MNNLFTSKLGLESVELIIAALSKISNQLEPFMIEKSDFCEFEKVYNQIRGFYMKKLSKIGSDSVSQEDIETYLNEKWKYKYHPAELTGYVHNASSIVNENCLDNVQEFDGDYLDCAFKNYFHMYSLHNYIYGFYDFLIQEFKEIGSDFLRLVNDELFNMRNAYFSKIRITYVHLMNFAVLSRNQANINIAIGIVCGDFYVNEDKELNYSTYKHLSYNRESSHGLNHHHHSDNLIEAIKEAKSFF